MEVKKNKNCLVCFKSFPKNPKYSKIQWKKASFCSPLCQRAFPDTDKTRFKKRQASLKRIKEYPHTLPNRPEGRPKSKPTGYAASVIGYSSLHSWVRRKLGTPKYCAYCKNNSLKHRQYGWANISHAYKRELSDWIRLCKKCHHAYDTGKITLGS